MFGDFSNFGQKMAKLIEKILKICNCLIKNHLVYTSYRKMIYSQEKKTTS